LAKIRVKVLNYFHFTTKQTYLDYEGDTVGDVILQFVADYKEVLDPMLLTEDKTDFKPEPVNILLNGRNILYLEYYNTPVKEGDLIVLSMAIAGG
jgi:molybdopterin converting factor small subunit